MRPKSLPCYGLATTSQEYWSLGTYICTLYNAGISPLIDCFFSFFFFSFFSTIIKGNKQIVRNIKYRETYRNPNQRVTLIIQPCCSGHKLMK